MQLILVIDMKTQSSKGQLVLHAFIYLVLNTRLTASSVV